MIQTASGARSDELSAGPCRDLEPVVASDARRWRPRRHAAHVRPVLHRAVVLQGARAAQAGRALLDLPAAEPVRLPRARTQPSTASPRGWPPGTVENMTEDAVARRHATRGRTDRPSARPATCAPGSAARRRSAARRHASAGSAASDSHESRRDVAELEHRERGRRGAHGTSRRRRGAGAHSCPGAASRNFGQTVGRRARRRLARQRREVGAMADVGRQVGPSQAVGRIASLRGHARRTSKPARPRQPPAALAGDRTCARPSPTEQPPRGARALRHQTSVAAQAARGPASSRQPATSRSARTWRPSSRVDEISAES